MRASALTVGLMLLASPAFAEETICTPDHYYNWNEPAPLIIPIDAARAAGSWVTRVDIETGAYRQHHITDETFTGESGTFTILNPGSLKERIDFAAVDRQSGLMLRISLVDEGRPFVRVSSEGTVASGHCVYQSELPR
ncbi:MAG: hypothetical protein JWQ89_3677 [Devosia sp.]|uniref:hypothetical protein n=1 Tax=Devosia sp. TaxID=1871048 RepID=UPI002612B4DF|nr:hypothetical protein [Devosia sp.]MDB5541950.1 hypothetical protein [Devosia sp.]